MVRHVIYGALVGRFIMKLAERFTMSFGKFVPAHIDPCALIMRYGNADIWCAVARNDIIARKVCDYLERNHPGIAPNFYIGGKIVDSRWGMMGKSFTEQFRSGEIQNIKIFAEITPKSAYLPLRRAVISLPPLKAKH